jgi:hypothetical protein
MGVTMQAPAPDLLSNLLGHAEIDNIIEFQAAWTFRTVPSPTSATRAKKIGKLLILRSRIFKGRHYTLDFLVRR